MGLPAIFIETKSGQFSNSLTESPTTLTISLDGPHKTPPIVTIGHKENTDASSYNFFINEVISTGLFTYDVIIGVSGDDGSIRDSNTDPIILVHAMSYV